MTLCSVHLGHLAQCLPRYLIFHTLVHDVLQAVRDGTIGLGVTHSVTMPEFSAGITNL